jgi:Ulp1 family protease
MNRLRRKTLQYLQTEAAVWNVQVNAEEWDISCSTFSPQQGWHNSTDCGVYMVMVADFYATELPITATNDNNKYVLHNDYINHFRRKIFADIIRGYITY